MRGQSSLQGRRWRDAVISMVVALSQSGSAIVERDCAVLPSGRDSQERFIGTPDSLDLRLSVPEQVLQGETLRFTLSVENVSGRRLDLYLRGREITFDALVTDLAGIPVWRRLEGEVLPAIVRIEPLADGAVLELSGLWNQRRSSGELVSPGAYCIQAELLTESQPLRSPVIQFEIEFAR